MTDVEFQNLMKLKKVFVKEAIELPNNGENETYDLESIATRDKFYLDVDRRGRIELSRFKLQNRYRLSTAFKSRWDKNLKKPYTYL